jgi:hypothetical protein
MAETTHEALVRQVGATEEMLAYFQGQRDQFNGNVADAQAAYDALAANLVGILPERTLFTTFYDPTSETNDFSPGGHFKDWIGLKDLILQLPNNAAVRVVLPRDSVLLVTGAISSNPAFSVNLYFEASGPAAISADSPVIRLQSYDGVTYSQYRSIDLGAKGSLEASGVVFEWEDPVNDALPFSSNTFAVSFRAENMVRLYSCKIQNAHGRAFSRVSSGSIARLSLNIVEIDGAGVMALKRDAAASVAIIAASTVTLTNGALVHHDTFTRGGDLFTNYVQA